MANDPMITNNPESIDVIISTMLPLPLISTKQRDISSMVFSVLLYIEKRRKLKATMYDIQNTEQSVNCTFPLIGFKCVLPSSFRIRLHGNIPKSRAKTKIGHNVSKNWRTISKWREKRDCAVYCNVYVVTVC